MKVILLIALMLSSNIVLGQGLFVESNFSDTEYTVKARALDVVRADKNHTMETARLTTNEILDVYHGNLTPGTKIDLIIESDILKNQYRLALLRGEFLTSFCLSDTGIYYTNILFYPSIKNIEALENFRDKGTDHWDNHDCDYTNSKVTPPDGLYLVTDSVSSSFTAAP